ncbi:hypothetical protein JQ604_09860 [Bradyrhizobium jicamae]|uniref:hypothetical protein n=1 Tax=Bradyrhizobium jicamae TaxID=280332 RepID=UPI001BA970DB|nr:hypothetical protein [Bradyrhizobium jicamae]MBR0752491.1 hypothetical protein [Bradyrhizobium jicamae]
MGVLTDIRSGKRGSLGLGYEIVFWSMAGMAAGAGIGSWIGLNMEKALLPLALIGFTVGICVGFYAAFGATRMARVLALPGAALAIIGMLVGL